MKKETQTSASEVQSMSLEDLNIKEVFVPIRGLSPLICNRFSEKAKEQILVPKDKKTSVEKRPPRNAQEFFKNSLYPIDAEKGIYGFPSSGFKKAVISTGRYIDTLNMTYLRGVFFIMEKLVKIDGTPTMREDIVRLTRGTPDVRYRAEFKEWKAVLKVRYNEGAISHEQLINLFNLAGFCSGIGDWRPEKSGMNGMFEVING